jgi:hypothetical protein
VGEHGPPYYRDKKVVGVFVRFSAPLHRSGARCERLNEVEVEVIKSSVLIEPSELGEAKEVERQVPVPPASVPK